MNLIFSGALIDERAGAHHPETAHEALTEISQIERHEQQQHRKGRRQIPWANVLNRVQKQDASISSELEKGNA